MICVLVWWFMILWCVVLGVCSLCCVVLCVGCGVLLCWVFDDVVYCVWCLLWFGDCVVECVLFWCVYVAFSCCDVVCAGCCGMC